MIRKKIISSSLYPLGLILIAEKQGCGLLETVNSFRAFPLPFDLQSGI